MIFPHFSAQLFLRIVCSKITLLIILVEVLNIDFFERSLIITCKKSEGFFCFASLRTTKHTFINIYVFNKHQVSYGNESRKIFHRFF